MRHLEPHRLDDLRKIYEPQGSTAVGAICVSRKFKSKEKADERDWIE